MTDTEQERAPFPPPQESINAAVGRMLGPPPKPRARVQAGAQQTLPLPNPGDWCSVDGAAALLQVTRSSVYRFYDKGLIKIHYVNALPLLWKADVVELATARARAGVGGP